MRCGAVRHIIAYRCFNPICSLQQYPVFCCLYASISKDAGCSDLFGAVLKKFIKALFSAGLFCSKIISNK